MKTMWVVRLPNGEYIKSAERGVVHSTPYMMSAKLYTQGAAKYRAAVLNGIVIPYSWLEAEHERLVQRWLKS